MEEGIYQEIFEYLELIREDQDTNKSLRERISKIEDILKDESIELRAQKAMFELEEVCSQNISPYLKTQIWDVITQLESINN